MTRDWSAVEEAVRQAEQHGTVGVSIIGPDGDRWERNGGRKFRAASTVKIPLMIEIYHQVERGETLLDELHTLRNEEKAKGSGVMLHLHDGLGLTIEDIVYLMISISDNTATNLLIRRAGMDAVNTTMREIGMPDSNLSREMKGRPAHEGEEENLATPNDYTRVVQAILDNEAASSKSCEAMTAMLEKQQNTRRIARYLPLDDEDIRWGTKTGSIKGVTNDVGFILSPKGRLVIGVFCEGMPDQHTGEQAIGDISRAAMKSTGIVEPVR